MKKAIFILIVLAGAGFLGWRVYEKATAMPQKENRQKRNVPVAVEVTPLKRMDLREASDFSGTLYPLSQYVLAPKIAGRLEKLRVNIGDKVSADQEVALLDDAEMRQAILQAKADQEVAKATVEEEKILLQNARREFERTGTLFKKKIASQSQLDAAESDFSAQKAKLKVAMAQLDQKRAALETARVRLSYTRITTPSNHVNGFRVVGEKFVDEGAMLAANTPIVSILEIGILVARIHVIERDYAKVRMGVEAEITTDAYPGRVFSGRVIRISPLLAETSRSAVVEVQIPNRQVLLKPGMFIRATLVFSHHPDAVGVPTAALVTRDGRQGVFMADHAGKKADFVPLSIGVTDGPYAQVLDGPASGRVITLGYHLLKDGANIIITNSESKKGGKSGSTPPGEKGKSGGASSGNQGKSNKAASEKGGKS